MRPGRSVCTHIQNGHPDGSLFRTGTISDFLVCDSPFGSSLFLLTGPAPSRWLRPLTASSDITGSSALLTRGKGGGEGGKGEVIYMTFPLFFVHPLFKGRLMYLPNGPLMADTKIAALPCPIRADAAQSGSTPWLVPWRIWHVCIRKIQFIFSDILNFKSAVLS